MRELYEPWNVTTPEHLDTVDTRDESNSSSSDSESDQPSDVPIARRLRKRHPIPDAPRKPHHEKVPAQKPKIITSSESDHEFIPDLPPVHHDATRALRPRRELQKPVRYR